MYGGKPYPTRLVSTRRVPTATPVRRYTTGGALRMFSGLGEAEGASEPMPLWQYVVGGVLVGVVAAIGYNAISG